MKHLWNNMCSPNRSFISKQSAVHTILYVAVSSNDEEGLIFSGGWENWKGLIVNKTRTPTL